MNPLEQLQSCGQAPWLDFLIRSLVEKGELKTMIERDGLKGVTSNPSIFEKAIGESDEYSVEIKSLLSERDRSITEIYEHLAIADIQAAADVLRVVYDQTQGRDGYVSLECSPYLANDTEATVAEGLHLWEFGRPSQSDGEGSGDACGHPRHPPPDRRWRERQRHPAFLS